MDILIDNLRHAYGSLSVLDGLSLDIRSGEIVCLLGPSGCGKSTLLRLVAGLERPSAGRILTRGAPPRQSLHPIAVVFQDFALVPWRTAIKNIQLPLEHHRLSRQERRHRITSALRRVKLTEFAHAYPNRLSGGMRQRIGLARALVVDPAILLLDEPFSAVDVATREFLRQDLIRLWQEARFTTLFVTHDVSEATQVAQKVVVLSKRPARVRAVIDIDIPIAERVEGHPTLVAMRHAIRTMIRDEVETSGWEREGAP